MPAGAAGTTPSTNTVSATASTSRIRRGTSRDPNTGATITIAPTRANTAANRSSHSCVASAPASWVGRHSCTSSGMLV